MIEVRIPHEMVNLPYTLRLDGVAEEMYDQLLNEDIKADLIDGDLIMHSPASLQHESISSFLGGLMSFYAGAKNLGIAIGSGNAVFQLSTGRKVCPDAFFISRERVPAPLPKQFQGAPDLAIEVLSSSNRDY